MQPLGRKQRTTAPDLQMQAAPAPLPGSEMPTTTEELPAIMPTPETAGPPPETALEGDKKVNLDKIIVASDEMPEGKILSIDQENAFVIINLGENYGLQEGTQLSVFRKENYLGDIVISRVQPEMAAADFVPPLTGRKIRKNDRVLAKK